MYEHEDEQPERVEPLRVHLTGADIPMINPPGRVRRRGVVFRTLTITTADPVQQLLPQAELRCEAWVQGLDNDVQVFASLADAQSGRGGATIPAFNRSPFPLHTHDAVWVTAVTKPSTVTVVMIIEGPG